MNFRKLCKTAPLALVVAAGAFAATAHAEPYNSGDDVTIYSPYVVKKQRVAGSALRGQQELTVSRSISLRDYDLRSRDDIHQLNREVEFTARDVCDQAARLEPASYSPGEARECYTEALRGAQRQVNRAVNRANYRY